MVQKHNSQGGKKALAIDTYTMTNIWNVKTAILRVIFPSEQCCAGSTRQQYLQDKKMSGDHKSIHESEGLYGVQVESQHCAT
ncbi:unnamed protein product [Arctogadus glacialis]